MQQLTRKKLASLFRKSLWLIWLIIILFLSFIPGEKLPEITLEIVSIDTVVHIIMYMVLAGLMLWAFENEMNHFVFMLYLAVISSCVLLGLGVEFIQGSYVDNRFFSWGDAIANGVGTIVGLILYVWISKKMFKVW